MPFGFFQVRLVKPVVTQNLLGLEPERTLGVLVDERAKGGQHVVELAELALLVGEVKGDFVAVVKVWVLALQAVVELHRLLLQ